VFLGIASNKGVGPRNIFKKKSAVFSVKIADIFSIIYAENILKIITLAPARCQIEREFFRRFFGSKERSFFL
jgi:hypothetical protein